MTLNALLTNKRIRFIHLSRYETHLNEIKHIHAYQYSVGCTNKIVKNTLKYEYCPENFVGYKKYNLTNRMQK